MSNIGIKSYCQKWLKYAKIKGQLNTNVYEELTIGLDSDAMEAMTDEELVVLYQANGDERLVEVMLSRYERMIRGQTRCLFNKHTTKEDLFQEGQIGFFKAMQGYDAAKAIPFAVFAQRCVRCQFITAIKSVQRLKHQPLNSALSLEQSIASDGEDYTILDILASDYEEDNPENCIIMQEDFKYCQQVVAKVLSPFDYRIFMGYVAGKSYQLIAAENGGNIKSVDNALQRSKRKLRRHIMNHQDIQVETFHNYLIMQQRVLREKEENEFLLAAKPLTVTAVDTIESIA